MLARDIEPGRDYRRARTGHLPDRVAVTSVTPQRMCPTSMSVEGVATPARTRTTGR